LFDIIIFVLVLLLFPSDVDTNPRALAQVLPADSESCQLKTCKRLFDELQVKIFNIEQNLFEEMNLLKGKLEDYHKRGRIDQRIET